jgi:hypothetical protein
MAVVLHIQEIQHWGSSRGGPVAADGDRGDGREQTVGCARLMILNVSQKFGGFSQLAVPRRHNRHWGVHAGVDASSGFGVEAWNHWLRLEHLPICLHLDGSCSLQISLSSPSIVTPASATAQSRMG